jgi:peptidase E
MALIAGGFGCGGSGGGKGLPSARSTGPLIAGLSAGRLTEQITGSTIKTVKMETVKTSAVFFKGVALLEGILRRRT